MMAAVRANLLVYPSLACCSQKELVIFLCARLASPRGGPGFARLSKLTPCSNPQLLYTVAVIFIPVFAQNIETLLAGQILSGVSSSFRLEEDDLSDRRFLTLLTLMT